MPGVPDQLYVRARAALLDALVALEPHIDAVVLVGAQAIYLHTGDGDLSVAVYTTDADFSISPGDLMDWPLLGDLLTESGFVAQLDAGRWLSPDGIYLDLMAPEALSGAGRRGARLGAHGNRVARRVKGLEGALIDRQRSIITSLDPADRRAIAMWVAGPGALLIAKIHKIGERAGDASRVRDKDALDVLRLLRSVDTTSMAERIDLLLTSDVAGTVTIEAIDMLAEYFGRTAAEGIAMAVRSAGSNERPETISESLVALVDDLLRTLA